MSANRLAFPVVGLLAGVLSSGYIFWPLIKEIRYVSEQKAAGKPLDAEAIEFMRQFGEPRSDVVKAAEKNTAANHLPKRHEDL